MSGKTMEALLGEMNALTKKVTEMQAAQSQQSEEDADDLKKITKGGSSSVISKSASFEEKTMKVFGTKSVQGLIGVNTSSAEFARVPEEMKAAVIDLKKSVENARWIAQMFHDEKLDKLGNAEEKDDRIASVKMFASRYGQEELAPRLAAFTGTSTKSFLSTGATTGGNWVDTLLSSQYIDEYLLDRVIEDKMQQFPMPSPTYRFPVVGGSTKARQIAENTQIIDKNFTTGYLEFQAKKLGEFYILPEELNEDSVVPFLEIARQKNILAQRLAVEAAIINGDADGTHIDSDTQALPADVAEKLWHGLRRQALTNTANGGTVDFNAAVATKTMLNKMRTKMSKFGTRASDLMYIFGAGASIQLQDIPEVNTIDKYGPRATIITGELEKIGGVPIIVSEEMRTDLNATGVYDGVTTNRTGILLVNSLRWWIGRRRPIQLRVEKDLPNQDRWLIASYQRLDFKGMPQSASEVSVVYGYNVAQ